MDCKPNVKIKVRFHIFRHDITTLSGEKVFGERRDSDSQIYFNQQESSTHGEYSFSSKIRSLVSVPALQLGKGFFRNGPVARQE